MANYIFDFDGTIADSFSLACDIIIKQSRYLGCKQLTPSELTNLKEMHAREALKYLQVPFWRTPFFIKKLRRLGSERLNEVKIFPEWRVVLKSLQVDGHVLGIISKYNLLAFFRFIVGNQSLFAKKRSLSKLITSHEFDQNETYYIGDEVRDIEAAHTDKIHSVAVSWGFNSINRLQQAMPEQFIMNITQLESALLK